MAEHFDTTVGALFKGMEEFVTSKTVVGEPIQVGETTILPLIDVSFGIMASARNEEKRTNGGGGMGGKMSPSALLVIKDGSTKLVNITNADSISRLIDMAPDLINRIVPGKKKADTPEERQAMEKAAEDAKKFGDRIRLRGMC